MATDILEMVNILNENVIEKKVDETFDKLVSSKIESDEYDFSGEFSEDPFYIELNGFRDPSDLGKYLSKYLDKFKKAAAESRLDRNKILQTEISQRIFSIRSELEHLLLVSPSGKYRNFSSLIKLKISYCDEILLFISNIKNEVFKLLRKTNGDYTSLNQKQIVILFHHLHKLGFVGKGMDNTKFADLVAEITDFSSNRIRQDLSNILDIDSLGFLQSDYLEVQKALNKVINSVIAESKTKLPPKP